MLLSLDFSPDVHLLFHRLKVDSIIIVQSFWALTLYECYFPKGRKIIPEAFLCMVPFLVLVSAFDSFVSLPIKYVEIQTWISVFKYRFGTTHIFYSIYNITFLLSLIASLIYFIFSKTKGKKAQFVILFVASIICGINDFTVAQRFSNNIMLTEYFMFFVVGFIFIEFLLEDRRLHQAVVQLKDEAIRRLKITEIYTRRSIVEEIEKGNDPTKFQPNNVQIATLFADVRNFTGISEGLKPLEVVELLNSYFDCMNSTIIKYNGEIDKLMGDCIMALFRDPDDALKVAIEMRVELYKFNLKSDFIKKHDLSILEQNKNELSLKFINNGIGLNYGEVVIGNIGSDSKMDYTVIGDIVNTASRLETLTKSYKVPLIISEDLKIKLRDNYDIRFLDEVYIKGKKTSVKIYEVYDFETEDNKALRVENNDQLCEAFKLYQNGDFNGALHLYLELLKKNEQPDIEASLFQLPGKRIDPILPFLIDRCRTLQIKRDAGLLKSWTGIFEFMEK
jgi:class 3 adenylate cyclase